MKIADYRPGLRVRIREVGHISRGKTIARYGWTTGPEPVKSDRNGSNYYAVVRCDDGVEREVLVQRLINSNNREVAS